MRRFNLRGRLNGLSSEGDGAHNDQRTPEPIDCDKACEQALGFEQLRAQLVVAFSAPESSYELLSAVEVIDRNQR